MKRTLDWKPHHDPRSRGFPIAAVVPEALRGRSFWCPVYLDQGSEGACVSFAWHHEGAASPAMARGLSNQLARDRYFEMQRRDEWPGGAYPGAEVFYEGTSVNAGALVMRDLGFFDEYRWAFSIDDVMRGISHEGPCVLGLPWLDSMFEPRPDGLLDCSGSVAGGHAILARGLLLKPRLAGVSEPVIRKRNSWGRSWGVEGDCFIRVSDLERLLADWGEACFPVARKRPA